MTQSPVSQLLPGSHFEGFLIEKVLGSGGMGTVYRARRGPLTCALKLIHDISPRSRARFEREALALARLGQHPNIVPIHDYSSSSPLPFMATAFIDGQDLGKILEQRSSLPLTEAASIVALVARAIQHCHDQGITHRDLKPENVLRRSDGQIFLTDFGLARDDSQEGLTRTGEALGTPHTMAPEQLLAQSTSSAVDIWALGVLLYRLCTGHWPFDGHSNMELVGQILHADPASVREHKPELPRDLDRLLRSALQKSPEQRTINARTFAAACEELAKGGSISTAHVPERPALASLTKPALVLILAAILIVGFFAWQRRQSTRDAWQELSSILSQRFDNLQMDSVTEFLSEQSLDLRPPADPISLAELEALRRRPREGFHRLSTEQQQLISGRLQALAALQALRGKDALPLDGLIDSPWNALAKASRDQDPGQLLRLSESSGDLALIANLALANRFEDRALYELAGNHLRAALAGVSERLRPTIEERILRLNAAEISARLIAERNDLDALRQLLESVLGAKPDAGLLSEQLNQNIAKKLEELREDPAAQSRALERLDQLSRQWPLERPRLSPAAHEALAVLSTEPSLRLYHRLQAAIAARLEKLPEDLQLHNIGSALQTQLALRGNNSIPVITDALLLCAEAASAGFILDAMTHNDTRLIAKMPETRVTLNRRPWDQGYQFWRFLLECERDPDPKKWNEEIQSLRHSLRQLHSSKTLTEAQLGFADTLFAHRLYLTSQNTDQGLLLLREALHRLIPLKKGTIYKLDEYYFELMLVMNALAQFDESSRTSALDDVLNTLPKLSEAIDERILRTRERTLDSGRPLQSPIAALEDSPGHSRLFEGTRLAFRLARQSGAHDSAQSLVPKLRALLQSQPWFIDSMTQTLLELGEIKLAEALIDDISRQNLLPDHKVSLESAKNRINERKKESSK